jgi:phage/plasmid primase-like uncharacterized protein
MTRMDYATVAAAAVGRWPDILGALGIADHHLTRRHGPCPGCGGRDRYRFDDRDGRGTWICGGGGNPQAGDGFGLLRHVYGWTAAEALHAVARYLGMDADAAGAPPTRPAPRPAPPVAPPEPSRTQAYALELWARADRDSAAVASHPYARRKAIDWHAGAGRARASGRVIGADADCLLVPVRALNDYRVIAVECISATGVKQSFGPKADGALPLGNRLNHRLERHVCEGWATGVHLWRALGNVVVWVAFGAGRMRALAEWIEANQPGGAVYIAQEAPADAA